MSDARQTPGFGARDSGLDTRGSGLGTRDSGDTIPVDLDVAIDAVAREMTEGEPSGALRARVLERIEQGRRHALPAVPRWAWAGAAAAVLLAVATAVWLTGPLRTPGDSPTTVARQRSGVPSPAAAGSGVTTVQPATASTDTPSPEGAPAGTPAGASRTRRAVAVQGTRAAGQEAAEDFKTVPALAEIEPLRFASVEPAPLHLTDMEISSIAEMPSIDIPSLDTGSNDPQSADPKKEK